MSKKINNENDLDKNIEYIFPNVLDHDLTCKYSFQKNYLLSLCKIQDKNLNHIINFLKENGIKNPVGVARNTNKGLVPKKYKIRQLIANCLDMTQDKIFINLERMDTTSQEYLNSVKRWKIKKNE